MRWAAQQVNEPVDGRADEPVNMQGLTAEDAVEVPSLVRLSSLVRSVRTPEFGGMTFHEVLARTALNRVPETSRMLPGAWTINPYRGCSHACFYCYARPTHQYLDLDAGDDFDRQIVVKVNVAEVLARELAGTRARPAQVALGTNTDPYQRAEGRYALMPGIVAALDGAGVPFSVLTKGTLLRRDLPLLGEVNERRPVTVALSIAVVDDELQQSLEPGTPSTAARLATVRQVRDHGMDCSVFLAPVLPFLTDSTEDLDRLLAQVKEAGATSVLFTALRLAPGVKEWFLGWLGREHPEQLPRYQQLYAAGARPPESYQRVLAARMQILLRRHGLLDGVQRSPELERSTAQRFSLGPEHREPGRGPARPATAAARICPPVEQGEQPLLF